MARRRAVPDDEAYLRSRGARLLRVYGITLEEYDQIKEVQDGTCFICKRAKGISTPLQVDHDHAATGRLSVRGLLCGRCNNRLGWYEARADLIAEYLGSPPAHRVIPRGGA